MVKPTLALSLLVLACSASHVMAWQKPAEVLFAATDSDRNGAVSESEWHTAMQKRFEALDTNRDGILSREEFAAARQTLREQFRHRQNVN